MCLKPFPGLGHFSAGIIDDRARQNNCAIVSNTLKEDVRVARAANEFQEAGVRRAITFPIESTWGLFTDFHGRDILCERNILSENSN